MRDYLILLCSLSMCMSSFAYSEGQELSLENESEILLEELGFSLVFQDDVRVILEPRNEATLSAEIDSNVESIPFGLGEAFQEGDVLVQMRDDFYEAAFERTKALHEKAQTEVEVRQALFADDVASRLELAEAEAAFKVSKADMAQAYERLRSCTVRAPYNGKIVSIDVGEHEIVRQGQPLVGIVDDTILVARFLVPSHAISGVKIGDTVLVAVEESNSIEQAVITHIDAVINPSSSMIKVEAEIENHDDRLRAGMIGKTTIKTGMKNE